MRRIVRYLVGALLVTTNAFGASVTLVTLGYDGRIADSRSFHPAVSGDGTTIAYTSQASNLVPGDTNGRQDVFVYDRRSGTTTRITDSPFGSSTPGVGGVSSDGAIFVFQQDGIQVYERSTGLTTLIANGVSPCLSADGRFVAFLSTTVVPGVVPPDNNNAVDVVVFDRLSGTSERVSTTSDDLEAGGQGIGTNLAFGPSLSADGRYVAFTSGLSTLVPGDTNGADDVFVKDRTTRVMQRVSVSSNGDQAELESGQASISADGRFVAFHSEARNLVAGDSNGTTDVFVHDRATGVTERVSIATDGTPGAGRSFRPVISADGRFVTFESLAGNLSPDDTSTPQDVFVRDRVGGTTTRVSADSDGTSGFPAINADGRFVAFESDGFNPGGNGGILLYDRDGVASIPPVSPFKKAITVRCDHPADGAAGGSCGAVGFAAVSMPLAAVLRGGDRASLQVTKAVVRRFNKRRTRVDLPLRLNSTGRKLVRQRGSLSVIVRLTLSDGVGAQTTSELSTLVVPRVQTGGGGGGGGR